VAFQKQPFAFFQQLVPAPDDRISLVEYQRIEKMGPISQFEDPLKGSMVVWVPTAE
jgi:hypothetical protein